MKDYLVIDVGGSSIKYGITNETLEMKEKGKVPVPLDTMENFVEAIGQLYDQFKERISGIAISMPGVIDPDKGYSYSGGALKYIKNLPTVDLLKARCDTNITIGNDAKCAANAEVGFGALNDVDDSMVIVLGTGIGGCVIKDKKVVTGKHFSAGEFSFIKCDAYHGTDFSNCWAMINGISGLLKVYQEETGITENVSGFEIFEAVNHGVPEACKALERFCEYLAVEIFNLQVILDPDKFAIGGGISAQPVLFEYIEKALDVVTQHSGPIPRPVVVPCKFNNDANLYGALYQHITTYK